MVYLAQAFDTGDNLGSRQQSWEEAFLWYGRAVAAGAERGYILVARQAELARLAAQPKRAAELYEEAAELAMEGMSGKLATR